MFASSHKVQSGYPYRDYHAYSGPTSVSFGLSLRAGYYEAWNLGCFHNNLLTWYPSKSSGVASFDYENLAWAVLIFPNAWFFEDWLCLHKILVGFG